MAGTASWLAVAIQAATNKISWAKMLKNSINTITGPKMLAARLYCEEVEQ